MIFPFLLQLAPAQVAWRTTDHVQWHWRAGSQAYEVFLEESVPPSRHEDPEHRIRVKVPGRRDFIVLDDRGPGDFVSSREGLQMADAPTRARLRRLGQHLVADDSRRLLFAFGYSYTSDPGLLVAIGIDSTGYPVLVQKKEMVLVSVRDSSIVVRPTMPQGIGLSNCHTTYDPYAVLVLVARDSLTYSEALSRSYNEAHYVWRGPQVNEHLEVDACTPGKYRVVKESPPSL